MKKNILLTLLLVTTYFSLAQNVIYSEDFESAHSFTLNSTDESSTLSGENLWVVNDVYNGGTINFNCPGFGTFSVPVAANSSQPGTFTNAPTSNYMHITSTQGNNQGISNAHYAAADGVCVTAENHFAKMTNDISTVGQNGVTLSFYYMCGGASGAIYGEVYFSTDGGTNWTVINTPIQQYSGVSNWTSQTITNAAFDNQSTLRFGFRFVNTSSGSATDPSFAIDEIEVTSSVPSITITENYNAQHCEEGSIDIDYTASGATFNAGNTFSLEMSDNTGSFASPTVIGTLNSTANSGTISGTFPNSISGTGYLLRVSSDDQAVTGTEGTTSLTITSPPDIDPISDLTACETYNLPAITGANLTGNEAYYNAPNGGGNSYNPGDQIASNTTLYIYDELGTPANCFDEELFTITINQNVDTSVTVTTTDISANATGITYEWLDCDANMLVTGETNQTFTPSTQGNYALIATDGDGACIDTSACYFINTGVGISEQTENLLSIYPNPTNGIVNIQTNEKIQQIVISNVFGQEVYNGVNTKINLSNYTKGIYFVTLKLMNHTITKKVILQ